MNMNRLIAQAVSLITSRGSGSHSPNLLSAPRSVPYNPISVSSAARSGRKRKRCSSKHDDVVVVVVDDDFACHWLPVPPPLQKRFAVRKSVTNTSSRSEVDAMSSETVTVVALAPTCITCCRFPAPCAAIRSASPHLYARVAGANAVPTSMMTSMMTTITSRLPVPPLLQTRFANTSSRNKGDPMGSGTATVASRVLSPSITRSPAKFLLWTVPPPSSSALRRPSSSSRRGSRKQRTRLSAFARSTRRWCWTLPRDVMQLSPPPWLPFSPNLLNQSFLHQRTLTIR